MSRICVLVVIGALAACAQGAAVRGLSFAMAPLGLGKVRGPGDIDGQIVGGWDAKPNEFPHQVSMQVVLPGFYWFDADPEHICGGALIATEWVLTAAHCVLGVPRRAKRVEAVMGITDLTKTPTGSQRILVSKMLSHEKYDPDTNDGLSGYDIGLLKLSSSAKLSESVKLASLPSAGSIPFGNAKLSGWGSTSSDGNNPIYPNKLQTAVFPIIDFDSCYKAVGKLLEPNVVVETHVCAGPLDRKGLSSCSGDSGGPLVQKAGDKVTVIGIVSWGLANCASIPFPSVFTRVSAYNTWIEDRIK